MVSGGGEAGWVIGGAEPPVVAEAAAFADIEMVLNVRWMRVSSPPNAAS